MPDSITLYELNQQIKDVINNSFQETLWVIAEIGELRENPNSGHCYLELVEKSEKNDTLKAKAKAIIWAYTYRMLKPYFETTTGRTLSDGLKVMVNVVVEFHELYSFSLNILDIDPTYTIGDLAMKKQEILNKLEQEGVIEMNIELEIPLIPQKIAIISSETAAGYDDFINQLVNNEFNYVFYHKLFPAIMQGDKAEESIIKAFDSIYKYEGYFDVVVIIRGGGSKLDLSCFDSYWLSYNITQFPLPVITGIGHERDDSIVDIVANTKLKTPTAVAEFLINKLYQFDDSLSELQDQIISGANDTLIYENQWLTNALLGFQNSAISKISLNKNKVHNLIQKTNTIANISINYKKNELSKKAQSLKTNYLKLWYENLQFIELIKSRANQISRNNFRIASNKLEIYKTTIELIDPGEVLKKGYSLTYLKGKLVKNLKQVQKNDEIETHISDGVICSQVQNKKRI